MLEVQHLTRRYGQFVAVDDVSFAMGKGEIVGLLGHNGAGKTTIMKMLSGYLEPDTGRITIGGVDLAQDPRTVQRMLGYLPENLPVYPEMSVADYLNYAARLKGLDGDDAASAIRESIAATDIADKLLAPISTLSRGYKQRVGVAQALLGRPGLLILDEPTNGLDPTQTEHMRNLIREIARNATVILSTHIMQEVDALCDRVLILRAGKLVVDERLEELRRSRHLLLRTSLKPLQAERQLAGMEGIGQVSVITSRAPADQYEYRVSLADSADASAVSAVSARVIRTLVENGAEVYALQPEKRDLESLFREVSQNPTSELKAKEELTHAA